MSSSKKTITDQERLELAARLDKELDDFIDSLEKKRYSEGWPEDRWQEEMDKHPFFMKKAPEPGEELHPLLEGIQKLKYDPEENKPEELAISYKEDGLFYVNHRKYRTAILSYTEGLKAKSKDNAINAELYDLRSDAHYYLKNYRSAIIDAEMALKLKPFAYQTVMRAAKCAYNLNKINICRNFLKIILEEHSGEYADDKKALELEKKCDKKQIEIDRNERKRLLAERRKAEELKRTIDEIKKRNIKFDDKRPSGDITEELLKPKLLPLEDYPVRADGEGNLTWPTAFSYPEFLLSDFYQKMEENVVMGDCVNDLFSIPLPCDKEERYKPGKLSVYYENKVAGRVHKVDLKKTIKEIIQEENFYVSGGSLLFYVVPEGSSVEEGFIHDPSRKPLVCS